MRQLYKLTVTENLPNNKERVREYTTDDPQLILSELVTRPWPQWSSLVVVVAKMP